MIAPWLARHFKLAGISTPILHGMFASLTMLGVLSKQRAAIAHEIAVRAWAEAVAGRLSESDCVWTARGGKS